MAQSRPPATDPKIIRKTYDENLYLFARDVLNFNDMTPDLHREYCDYLNKPNPKKLVLMSRGHLKTTIGAIAMPLHMYVNNPNLRFLVISSTQEKANSIMWLIRQLLQKETTTPMMKTLYADRIVDAKWQKKFPWSNEKILLPRTKTYEKEATFHAMSVNGSVSGFHFDAVIWDDPIDEKTMESEADMLHAIKFFKKRNPLFENPVTGVDIVIGTRYGYEDLYQFIINKLHYDLFYRSCVRDKVTKEPAYTLDDTVEPIWPERFTLDFFREERDQDPWLFSCNYFLNPMDEQQCVFNEKDLRYFELENDGHATLILVNDGIRINPGDCDVIMIVDPALSREQNNKACDSAIVVIAKHNSGRIYTLETYAETVNPYDLIENMYRLYEKWHPRCCYVEDVAYQGALMYMVHEKKDRRRFCRTEPIAPGGRSKDDRITGMEPWIRHHQVYVQKTQTKLINQIRNFQKGHKFQKKDILDALSYAPLVWKLPMTIQDFEKVTGQKFPDGYEDDFEYEYIPTISAGTGRDATTGY